ALVGDLTDNGSRAGLLPASARGLVGRFLPAAGRGQPENGQKREQTHASSHRWILLPRGPALFTGPSPGRFPPARRSILSALVGGRPDGWELLLGTEQPVSEVSQPREDV